MMTSKSSAREIVLKYLKTQNRPYSANDITLNLHKELGKTAVLKALDELVQGEVIREKIYGKQKVYAPLQEDCQSRDMDKELKELDGQIENVSQQLKNVDQQVKSKESILKDLQNQATTNDTKKERDHLSSVVKQLKDKIRVLSSTSVLIPKKDKDVLTKNLDKYTSEYRKRKRICMDIANSIMENYPKPKKTFFEEVGIETDEDVGCKL